jgi:hypothetical protein
LTDTPTDVQAHLDSLMRQRSGSDRVRMMSEMFDFAKALVLSNLRPSPSVTTDRVLSMSTGLDASTVTPGSTAPLASLTTPEKTL